MTKLYGLEMLFFGTTGVAHNAPVDSSLRLNPFFILNYYL